MSNWENEPKLTDQEKLIAEISAEKNVGLKACHTAIIALMSIAREDTDKGLVTDLAAAIPCFVNAASIMEAMDFLADLLNKMPADHTYTRDELLATYSLVRLKGSVESARMAQIIKRSLNALQMLDEKSEAPNAS